MGLDKIIFRKANIKDIPFLIDTIIEAEKSGTDILTYSTIFGLSEEDSRKYLASILEEEVDGCELSITSYMVAEIDNQIAAAISSWIEGIDGIPSTLLKGNLLNFTLPKECLERASSIAPIIADIHIEYIPNTIQIGLVYVSKVFRGRNLVRLLIDRQIEILLDGKIVPTSAYVQVYNNNLAAIKAYEKADFKRILYKKSTNKETLKYMPSDCKILMKRDL